MRRAETLFGDLLALDDAVAWREAQRAQKQRVVFTNGVFDVLHAGHVTYLAWAREQGDALIVGLNSDDSVRRIKGENRPIVPFEERARVLCALRSVDAVVGFAERTPEVILDRLRPDVHVKSAQYREDELPERDVVLQHGGEIRLAPHVAGTSTTDTIARILQRYR
ncbi:MAG TPA: adenylyltransferase/cytidyltransferase family protein [Candidatus Baltobacteraceae bacterium]|nr:adenylyltransferase/cytidyltransferase family protein [Candidatus Baltobacteraceae bacterium]